MCEGAAALYWFEPAGQFKLCDRRSLLNAHESFAWQKIRRESKGKLLRIPRVLMAIKLLEKISDLSNHEHHPISPGYALILTYIPIRYWSGGVIHDTFAFVLLHEESHYILPLNYLDTSKKAKPIYC
jgi:hypothetical protein